MPPALQSNAPTPPSIAVLVASCDKYGDLWPLFFELFAKFWPDCPHRVHLLTNHFRPALPGVVILPVGDDTSWSGNLRRALHLIHADYILLLVDDLFLCAPVNNGAVASLCAEFAAAGGNCLKLNPTVPGDRRFSATLDLSSPGSPYRASAVLTLWKKDLLHALLLEGETAWDFEIEGSRRSDAHEGFYVARQGQFQIVNGVIKGRWSRRARAQVAEAAGRPATGARPVQPLHTELLYQLALWRSRLLYRLPPGWGRMTLDRLRNIRNKMLRKTSSSRR